MQPQQPASSSQAFPLPANKSSRSLIAAIVFCLLFLVSAGFGVWAFLGKQSAQDNTQKQINSAVAAAKELQASELQAQFDEQLKQPYKSFAGPTTFGSIKFNYPKTWSAYVDQTSNSEPINAYFFPGEVPGTSSNTAYALRVELDTASYNSVLQKYQNQIESGLLKASVYVPQKLAKTANVQRGTMLIGELSTDQKGAMIIIPVRSQTLLVYTQSNNYLSDFNKIVLPNLTFSP